MIICFGILGLKMKTTTYNILLLLLGLFWHLIFKDHIDLFCRGVVIHFLIIRQVFRNKTFETMRISAPPLFQSQNVRISKAIEHRDTYLSPYTSFVLVARKWNVVQIKNTILCHQLRGDFNNFFNARIHLLKIFIAFNSLVIRPNYIFKTNLNNKATVTCFYNIINNFLFI